MLRKYYQMFYMGFFLCVNMGNDIRTRGPNYSWSQIFHSQIFSFSDFHFQIFSFSDFSFSDFLFSDFHS